MPTAPPTIETASAVLSLVEPWLIEQRYKSMAALTFENIHENSDARARLSPDHPCAVMIVFPKNVVPNPPVANEDHFRSERAKKHILALAVVADGSLMNSVSKLYFIFHPQAFETRVFEEEAAARRWLHAKLGELRTA